jgi:hypothetical protein
MLKDINPRCVAIGLLFAFLVNTVGPIPVTQAQEIVLPKPGMMVSLSPAFNPPILKGLKIHSDNPFCFDFILDKGDSRLGNDQLKSESTKLIKYFLASLTIPEKDLWVNLSPYEKDRIVPESFGQTEMGRDLLAEDYILKQITASLIYPEGKTGKEFWNRVYAVAAKKFGTTDVPVNTFNKVWIVPEKAVVYENAKAGTAYVVESKLKVMLERDYLSLTRHSERPPAGEAGSEESKGVNNLGSDILRSIVIPELTKEVNSGRNFSQLRQVYNSFILAVWYKKRIKDSILAQVYEDRNKIVGTGYDESLVPTLPGHQNKFNDVEAIYQRYFVAFKKGAYNYIKEEFDPAAQQPIPRKYFSGGVTLLSSLGLLETSLLPPDLSVHKPWRMGIVLKGLAANHGNEAMVVTDLNRIIAPDGRTLMEITRQLKDRMTYEEFYDRVRRFRTGGQPNNYTGDELDWVAFNLVQYSQEGRKKNRLSTTSLILQNMHSVWNGHSSPKNVSKTRPVLSKRLPVTYSSPLQIERKIAFDEMGFVLKTRSFEEPDMPNVLSAHFPWVQGIKEAAANLRFYQTNASFKQEDPENPGLPWGYEWGVELSSEAVNAIDPDAPTAAKAIAGPIELPYLSNPPQAGAYKDFNAIPSDLRMVYREAVARRLNAAGKANAVVHDVLMFLTLRSLGDGRFNISFRPQPDTTTNRYSNRAMIAAGLASDLRQLIGQVQKMHKNITYEELENEYKRYLPSLPYMDKSKNKDPLVVLLRLIALTSNGKLRKSEATKAIWDEIRTYFAPAPVFPAVSEIDQPVSAVTPEETGSSAVGAFAEILWNIKEPGKNGRTLRQLARQVLKEHPDMTYASLWDEYQTKSAFASGMELGGDSLLAMIKLIAINKFGRPRNSIIIKAILDEVHMFLIVHGISQKLDTIWMLGHIKQKGGINPSLLQLMRQVKRRMPEDRWNRVYEMNAPSASSLPTRFPELAAVKTIQIMNNQAPRDPQTIRMILAKIHEFYQEPETIEAESGTQAQRILPGQLLAEDKWTKRITAIAQELKEKGWYYEDWFDLFQKYTPRVLTISTVQPEIELVKLVASRGGFTKGSLRHSYEVDILLQRISSILSHRQTLSASLRALPQPSALVVQPVREVPRRPAPENPLKSASPLQIARKIVFYELNWRIQISSLQEPSLDVMQQKLAENFDLDAKTISQVSQYLSFHQISDYTGSHGSKEWVVGWKPGQPDNIEDPQAKEAARAITGPNWPNFEFRFSHIVNDSGVELAKEVEQRLKKTGFQHVVFHDVMKYVEIAPAGQREYNIVYRPDGTKMESGVIFELKVDTF